MADNCFEQHNQEVRALWKAFNEGTPWRVPVTVGISSRFAVFSKKLNPEGWTMKEYCQNPDVMFDLQLRLAEFTRFEVDADHEMGAPEDGWGVAVDFQNYYEAAWLGCPVEFPEIGMPTAHPFLRDDNKNEVFHRGIPSPFSGLMAQAEEFLEHFRSRAKGFTLHGQPVAHISNGAGLWTDGPFTIACEMRGLENFCIDMYEDPDYAHQLLNYTTDAIIQKTKAWRKHLDLPEKAEGYGFADDSITMLSPDMVEEWLVPCYKKMLAELCTPTASNGIHLCGDAGRLYPVLQRTLGLEFFDTGFPLDHGRLAKELNGKAAFSGGPHIGLLLNGTPDQVTAETKRILAEVMPVTRRFSMRDGNDIAPGTPMENIEAMVRATREFGVYDVVR